MISRALNRRVRRQLQDRHRGVAAAETAIVLPVMLILLMGAIDTGQALDVWNKVDNASRAGAREAARFDTTNSSEVDAAVLACLTSSFPGVSSSDLSSGLTVTTRDGNGNLLTNLAGVASGAPITVQVTLDYDTVRWVKTLKKFISKNNVTTTTQMRRE